MRILEEPSVVGDRSPTIRHLRPLVSRLYGEGVHLKLPQCQRSQRFEENEWMSDG